MNGVQRRTAAWAEDVNYRHWSPDSETYTSGDALLGALDKGWQVHGAVLREEHWLGGCRRVVVYHFRLSHGREFRRLVAVQNPRIDHLIRQLRLLVVQTKQHAAMESIFSAPTEPPV